MTADIFASLQTYTNPQTIQTTSSSPSQETEDPQVFAAMIDEFVALTEEPEVLGEPVDEQQAVSFMGNKSFARSVIDMLAGDTEVIPGEEETLMPSPENVDDEVTWPEDEKPVKAEAAPAEVRHVFSKERVSEQTENAELPDIEAGDTGEQVIPDDRVDDVPEELMEHVVDDVVAQPGHEDAPPAVKSPAPAPAPKADVPAKADEDEDTDDLVDSPEATETRADFSGVVAPQPLQEEGHEVTPPLTKGGRDIADRVPARQTRTVQADPQSPAQHDTETSTPQERTQTFREALETRTAEREENTPNDSQPQSQGQSQGQGHGNDGAGTRDSSPSFSRSRTDTRRTDSRTQAGSTDSPSAARRTDARSDFSVYFEGVLTSRRTASRTSPAPLDLRGTENFTQPSALRDGITNVVRFIRADGVQKARVIVDPPALGRISVELTSGTSGVEASIKVSSEQIRQLVQDQLSQLRMNLSQQGVQVAEFTVDVQQDNSGSQQQQGQSQNGQYTGYFGDDEDDETEEFRIDLEEGLLYWVA